MGKRAQAAGFSLLAASASAGALGCGDEVVVGGPAPSQISARASAAAPSSALSALASGSATAPSSSKPPRFVWRNPRTFGSVVNAAWTHSDGSLWAVGDNGLLLTGSTTKPELTQLEAGTSADLSAVFSPDGKLVVAVGSDREDGVVLRSEDGGATFETVHIKPRELNGIAGRSADDLYLIDTAGQVLRSTDSARTWSRLTDLDVRLGRAWVSPRGRIYMFGDKGKLWVSERSGAEPVELKTGVKDRLHAMWGDAEELVVVGGTYAGVGAHSGAILFSANSGARFARLDRGLKATAYAVCGMGATRLVTTGDGQILSAPHAHAPLTVALAGPGAPLTALSCDAKGNAVAFGGPGQTLRSSDSGASWEASPAATTDDLAALWGGGPDNLFAVGTANEKAVILHSSDRAHSWTRHPVDDVAALYDVWGSSPADVFAIGFQGAILHSTDGATWFAQKSGSKARLNAVWGSGATDVYVVGDRGTLLHSSDGGEHWLARESGTESDLVAIWGSGPRDVFIATSQQILHSTDGGASFQPQSISAKGWLSSIAGQGAADVFVSVQHEASLVHSADNGKTWQNRALPVHGLKAIAAGPKLVIGAGLDGELVSSSDGGTTWTVWHSGASSLSDVWMQGGLAVVVGQDGVVLTADVQ